MASFPTLDPAAFQSIVEGITGHASSGGLIAAVGTLIAGNIATGIITKAVSGGALSVIDPLGLATHIAAGGGAPAAGLPVANAATATPPATGPQLPMSIFLTLTTDQQKAFVSAGGHVG
jgi:hypothetical protein